MTRNLTMRKIIKIDEEKCNGCGVCIPSCAEGALQIIDGKAKLVKEQYCDGLGVCLGRCPRGALTVEEREAEAFDEEAALDHQQSVKREKEQEPLACGCPASTVSIFEPVRRQKEPAVVPDSAGQSSLSHWPVKLQLVPPAAPFLQGAELLLAADCVPFAYGGFHRNLLTAHALITGCPKLSDYDAHLNKLTEILKQSDIKSITVVRMTVPCCSGLVHMLKQALQMSGKDIPWSEIVVDPRGEIVS